MDTLVRQNKRKEKAKGADSRKRMHRESSGACRVDTDRVSISSRFISVQSITDFDRGFYLSIFYFLAPLEYRSSDGLYIYIYGFELFTRCTDGLWSRES